MECGEDVQCERWINAVNPVNKAALMSWVKETGTNLIQINGQRKYGGPPPDWVGAAPPSGSEVFIGKLPQDIYEDKLIPLFESVGKIYEFRLMMTFSGLNRGFAYARYNNRRNAQAAIASLNGYEVQKGHRIVVCRSTEKCELCVDGVPCRLEQGELKSALQEVTSGLVDLSLYPSPTKKRELLAVVKYNSHRAAAMAKKVLVEDSLRLYGQKLSVDWLKPDIKQKLRNSSPKAIIAHEDPGWTILCTPVEQLVDKKKTGQLKTRGCMVEFLNVICRKMQLGAPVFLTNLVAVSPEGVMRFWYQVVIPRYPLPFSGYTWVVPDKMGLLNEHDQAKESVAQQVLKTLGCSLV
ncbi:dead end protein homolog 1 [Ambystoma mexicanum]|uniref:dead end protein homolog 1 n=1 Tax=Ambystoma mexicanum TaxID=8296 RepID=UPI0037E6FEEA